MKDKNKKPAKVSKSEFILTLFVTFFFRSFIFLFIPGLIFIIVGIFRNECLIIGAVLLAIDLIISLYFTIKASRLKGSHEMFNAIVQAADENSDDDLDELNTKPDKEDLYSERAHELRRTASDAKSVRDVFELYKKDIADMALTDETCTVYIKKEKYFFDDQMHYVISFDRIREINDDIEQHMYIDILFAPDKFNPKIENSFECTPDGDAAEFYEQVGSHLETNGLLDLLIEDINVGASY